MDTRFKNSHSVPPGGFTYKVGDSLTIEASNFPALVQYYINYLNANKIPFKNEAEISEKLADSICDRFPDFCEDKTLTLLQKARKFSTAMLHWAESGFETVSKEVFDSRSKICHECPKWRGETAFGLGSCGSCGCTGLKLFLATESCPINKW